MTSRLRERRELLGLTQADLAAAAGLSRQLITALEAGRHAPSVTAALDIASVLDTSVEALFGDPGRRSWTPVTGEEAPEGTLVSTGRVGEKVVYSPVPRGHLFGPSWPNADGVVAAGTVRLFGDRPPEGFVVAGCDPALGLAAALLPGTGPRRVMAVASTSGAAVRALQSGSVHAALVHGPPERLGTPTPGATAVAVARWRVGLASRDPIDLDSIAEGNVTIARRRPGAEAQRALERALGEAARRPDGPLADGHLEAANLVAGGSADAGVTMEAAANLFDLEFTALEEHTVELRIADAWRGHPGAAALVDAFSSRSLAARLATFGGYELIA